jgi:hypothetical protein
MEAQIAELARQAHTTRACPRSSRSRGCRAEAVTAAKAAMLTRIFEQNLLIQKGA